MVSAKGMYACMPSLFGCFCFVLYCKSYVYSMACTSVGQHTSPRINHVGKCIFINVPTQL